MREPNKRDMEIADTIRRCSPGVGAVITVAAYREEIEAPLRAEIERLKGDRAELQTYIEEILKLEASLGTAFSWADLREFKEATRKIARAALAPSAPEVRTVKESLTVAAPEEPKP